MLKSLQSLKKTASCGEKKIFDMEMSKTYKIEPTRTGDLESVYELYEGAIRYQEQKGFPAWQDFDKTVLIDDVKNNNHYKVVMDSLTAIVFSVCYTEKVIWRQWEKGDAMYLHRIVANPAFKGQRLFALILEWAYDHARQKGLSFIRMDTWADNSSLVGYYKSFGFRFVENFTTPDNPELPAHNRNLKIALLEIRV